MFLRIDCRVRVSVLLLWRGQLSRCEHSRVLVPCNRRVVQGTAVVKQAGPTATILTILTVFIVIFAKSRKPNRIKALRAFFEVS